MRDLDNVFEALARSLFRRRFRLNVRDFNYLEQRGLETILTHASNFVSQRLAPAEPANDGKQTPMRGHPVFVAQHATATCCRGCLAKWHGIPTGRELTDEEQAQVVKAICCWLCGQMSFPIGTETGQSDPELPLEQVALRPPPRAGDFPP